MDVVAFVALLMLYCFVVLNGLPSGHMTGSEIALALWMTVLIVEESRQVWHPPSLAISLSPFDVLGGCVARATRATMISRPVAQTDRLWIAASPNGSATPGIDWTSSW